MYFKTIDDSTIIDTLIAERNEIHLNEVNGAPFTVEPLVSLIGKETFISFPQAILNRIVELYELQLSPTVQLYLKTLKRSKTIVDSATNNIIPYKEYIEGIKKRKEQITTSLLGRHLGHHRSLLKPDGI